MAIPTAIGRYNILSVIGQGGMGTLYLARDPIIERDVAIKVLREGLDDPGLRDRFAREAQSAGRLRHVNIVTIFDVGEHGGQPFIAMEFVRGQTLAYLLRGNKDETAEQAELRRAALPLPRKLQVVDEMCAGLHYAHKAGVVHRDIKPDNIILDEDGQVKILDFGIARLGAGGMTQAGFVMGTLNYMAPEQMEGKPVDGRSDMFAVGAVAYELFSYRSAFPGGERDMRSIMARIMVGKPDPLEQLCPDLDPGLIALVNRCLEKNPDNRYPDLDAMRKDLAKIKRRLLVEIEGDLPVDPLLSSQRPQTGKPGARTQERLRLRAEQLKRYIDEGRRALESGDFESAHAASQQALLLDPENAEAIDLEEGARLAREQRELREALDEARGEMDRGALTAASIRIDRALAMSTSSVEALELRQRVEDERRRLEAEEARRRQLAAAIARARQQLAAQQLDEARTSAAEAAGLDPANEEARGLAAQIAAALDARRRAEEEARARTAIADARSIFAAGDTSGAIAMLDRFQPSRPDISAAAAELRAEAREIERRRKEREEAERKARAEAERKAREDAERKAREEAERKAREESDRRAREEADRKAREAAERKARDDAERKAREEAERKSRDEAARRAREEADRKLREEREREAAEAPTMFGTPPPETLAFKRDDSPALQAKPPAAAELDRTIVLPRQPVPRPPAAPARPPVPPPAPVPPPPPADRPAVILPPVSAKVLGGVGALIAAAVLAYVFIPGSGPSPAPPPPEPVSVAFNIQPWARLEAITRTSDGQSVAGADLVTPVVVPLPPGQYRVRATNPEFQPLDFDVTVAPGAAQEVRQAMPGLQPEDEVARILRGQ